MDATTVCSPLRLKHTNTNAALPLQHSPTNTTTNNFAARLPAPPATFAPATCACDRPNRAAATRPRAARPWLDPLHLNIQDEEVAPMENMILDDSPLAEFLEGMLRFSALWRGPSSNTMPGQGSGGSRPSSPARSTSPDLYSFAPRGPSTLQSRIRDRLPQPLRIHGRHGSIARMHTACSVSPLKSVVKVVVTDWDAQKAVNSRIGRADNERFLEQFRYVIVASQLLGEQGGLRASSMSNFATHGRTGPPDFKVATISPVGAAITGSTAFVLVWLVHWSRRQPALSKGRSVLVLLAFAAVATAVYTYMRRQWLQYLRQEAVQSASALVTNLQAFEASTSSALALIQEVELVSRGYRLYVAMIPAKSTPPIYASLTFCTAAVPWPQFHDSKRKAKPDGVSVSGRISERPLLMWSLYSPSNAVS